MLGCIAEAASVDAAFDLALAHFREMGFARVNYGLTRFRTERSIGDPDDALFLSSCPPEYTQLYFNDGFFRRTPMFRWVSENNGTCTWRWVEEAFRAGTLPPDEMEAVRQNLAMDVRRACRSAFRPRRTGPRRRWG